MAPSIDWPPWSSRLLRRPRSSRWVVAPAAAHERCWGKSAPSAQRFPTQPQCNSSAALEANFITYCLLIPWYSHHMNSWLHTPNVRWNRERTIPEDYNHLADIIFEDLSNLFGCRPHKAGKSYQLASVGIHGNYWYNINNVHFFEVYIYIHTYTF